MAANLVSVPRKRSPDLSAAARMRRCRAAKRAAGLKLDRRWIDAASSGLGVYSEHSLLEARSLAMHCLIARRLSKQPALLRKAWDNIERWERRAAASPPPVLAEWRTILDAPLPKVLAFITSTSADATRLRQSTPFAGILTPLERKRVYEAFRA